MALDLLQNSVEAGSDTIALEWVDDGRELILRISDNGCGMTREEKAGALDPFYTDGVKHKNRRVGLGLPFLTQTVEMTGGSFSIESQKGEGTALSATFNLGHFDTPEPGSPIFLICQGFLFEGEYELTVRRYLKRGGKSGEYTVSRRELIEVLGDLNRVENIGMLKDFLTSQEEEIFSEE